MYGFSLEKEKKSFFVAKKQQGRRVHKADTDRVARGCGLKGEAMEANRAGEDIKMPRFR